MLEMLALLRYRRKAGISYLPVVSVGRNLRQFLRSDGRRDVQLIHSCASLCVQCLRTVPKWCPINFLRFRIKYE